MSLEKETEYSLAQIPFRNHTALLLGIALPYLTPAFRHPVELALKFLEFSETLRLYQEFHLSAKSELFPPKNTVPMASNTGGFFGLLHTCITDLEGLLTSLSGA